MKHTTRTFRFLFAPFHREEFLFAPFHRGTEITNKNKKTAAFSDILQFLRFIPNTEALVVHYSEGAGAGAGAGCGVRFRAQRTFVICRELSS